MASPFERDSKQIAQSGVNGQVTVGYVQVIVSYIRYDKRYTGKLTPRIPLSERCTTLWKCLLKSSLVSFEESQKSQMKMGVTNHKWHSTTVVIPISLEEVSPNTKEKYTY